MDQEDRCLKRLWKRLAGFCIGLGLLSGASADPHVVRDWTSSSGTTIQAKVQKVVDERVTLVRGDGRVIKLTRDQLSDTDQQFINKHFGEVGSIPEAPQASGLAHPLGEVVGPIEDGGGSHYFVYLPKSLKEDRKYPLMFWTNAQKGGAGLVKRMIDGAEVNGWVVACSVESHNKNEQSANHIYAVNSLKHLFKSLPIDKKRVYFAGYSGGAYMAFYNMREIEPTGVLCYGASDYNGVASRGIHCVFAAGARCFNRYGAASSAKRMGDDALTIFHPGDHNVVKKHAVTDGMLWLAGKYYADNRKKPEDWVDYERAMLKRIDWLAKSEPGKALYWATFLEEVGVSDAHQKDLAGHLEKLGQDAANRHYVEGVKAVDAFARKELSDFGMDTRKGHSDQGVKERAEAVAATYTDVPQVEKTLLGFGEESHVGKKK